MDDKEFGDFMREAVIVASSRTALAKSFRGSFNLTRPDELAAHCIQDVLRKTLGYDDERLVKLAEAGAFGKTGNIG